MADQQRQPFHDLVLKGFWIAVGAALFETVRAYLASRRVEVDEIDDAEITYVEIED